MVESHSNSINIEQSSSLQDSLRFERPSRAQAQIYSQIARGLNDVLMEYGLIGTADPSDTRVAATFEGLFNPEQPQSYVLKGKFDDKGKFLSWAYFNLDNEDCESVDSKAGNNLQIRKSLIKNLMIKREKLRTTHLRKRQLKMLEK